MQWGKELGNNLPKDAVSCEHLHGFKMRLDKLVGKKNHLGYKNQTCCLGSM